MKSELLDFICFLGEHDCDVGVEGEEGVVRDGQDCGGATKVDVSYVDLNLFFCVNISGHHGGQDYQLYRQQTHEIHLQIWEYKKLVVGLIPYS